MGNIIPEFVLMGILILGCQSSRVKELPHFPVLVEASRANVEVKQFLPNAYVVFHHLMSVTTNSLLVEMNSGDLVLVDTPVGDSGVEGLLSWIDYRMGKRKIHAIISSHRWDRAGGIAALKAHEIPIHVSDETKRHLARGEGGKPPAAIQDFSRSIPPHSFPLRRGHRLSFGSQKVIIKFPGKGYLSDNIIVHFPDSGILFVGGLVGMVKRFESSWLGALNEARKLNYRWLIPAEGRKLSPLMLDETQSRLESLRVAR